ncbi:hypothetical protein FJT64_022033 [Amphibalanus amphitrite]|uniref:Apple domain-containing protein n=1 Tax=Amphibalanus amphitrite TaxID=1232801 RepID=A0A6A4WI90_AMPAM|nr:hypothetical protein FJT64_022033 [Amphibalanus amphitrite]
MGSAAGSGWLTPLVWSGLLLVVSGLPPQSFVVHSALWHITIGQPDQSEVLASFGTMSECDCLTKCLTREDCLSFSHVPTDQSCTLYPVRGNVDSPRPERIRYRAALGKIRYMMVI